MKIKTKIIILVPVIVLIGLLITQFLIVKNSLNTEKENIEIIAETIKLEQSNFNSEVTLALTKVRDKLISLNKGNANIYLDPVKQIQDNYFVVSFYDTIPKTLLGNLIKEEFNSFYIDKTYKIGVYDCFTDSIIFDKFTNIDAKFPLKWDHDGYYFGVFFSNFKKTEPIKNSSLPYMLLLASMVIIVASLFTFYLANGILKQKKISKITYDFINNMTHELKTPISTISLSTDVLIKSQENNKDERLKRYLSIIKTENKRLENQVERVLEIAKLDKNKIDLNFEPLDIHDIISTCTDTFSVPIQEREGEISTELKANNPLINGDVIHVTNIIYNLFDNANKYSPNKPIINISTSNSNNGIIIKVSDNGIGIKKEDSKDIFNKFYRVSTGDVHNVKGFGLGLYYVKQMMLKHGGNIEIESIYKKGSTFILTFPIIN
ncbi:MAG: HAMP domain-containing sensor histidine kinase [Flavobacteriales bacterium]|nr:HAMP domain-containing histidine kinase [Flavobacteriales bacterium]